MVGKFGLLDGLFSTMHGRLIHLMPLTVGKTLTMTVWPIGKNTMPLLRNTAKRMQTGRLLNGLLQPLARRLHCNNGQVSQRLLRLVHS